MPFVCANRTLSSRCVLPISQQAAPVTFSNDVCTVIQRPKGTRGVLCDLHSKIDRCSLRLAEKCNGSAISWCFTRKHSMSALQPWQCIVAGVSEDLASRIDQLDGTTRARICRKCAGACKKLNDSGTQASTAPRRIVQPRGQGRGEEGGAQGLRNGQEGRGRGGRLGEEG